MTRTVFIALACWSGLAFAQMDAKSKGHNFSVLGSMQKGGFSLGAAYEYMYDGSTGIGGHIRTFPKNEATTGANAELNPSHGYMIFGATLGHHFFKGKWDLAFTPSFNIMSIDSESTANPPRPDDTTTMGPGLSISLLWSITEMIALGFDYSNYWVWFEDDYKGLQTDISDLAFRLKAGF